MAIRTNFPDGSYHIRYNSGDEWYNDKGFLHRLDGPADTDMHGYEAYYQEGEVHRLDGPAVIYGDGDIEYWVNGEIPLSILDILIILEEMDFEMFPSATPILNYHDADGFKAYRFSDPDELVLAILRYG